MKRAGTGSRLAGEADNTDAHGNFEPFGVFFDRTFAGAFATAVQSADGDEGKAAQLCATAYGKAFARWRVLGRVGDADRFIDRRITKRRTRRKATPPSLEVGVGYKPWVYVTATESGTSRKRAFWGVGAAASTIILSVGAIGWTQPKPSENRVSTETEILDSPATTTITTPPPTTLLTPAPSTSDPVPPATSADDETWTGFTLDLDNLPLSPAEVDAARPRPTAPDTTLPTIRFGLAPTVSLTTP